MVENSKKTRDAAELSFSKTQTQALTRSRIISEQDALIQARDIKTARLRELRLDKEAEDATHVDANPGSKRSGRRSLDPN
ncbi:hypothetical protein B5P45_03980 [Phyllobacterium zundukense]|uniref:Uncharacterized protein n=1 Tax=Phyllobacterium zundukense TaxID=1867719 RepID=A0A2N9W346_9HYPH|nr:MULTISPECIES: hypothetical protein [Phyllobacterium]ATU94322.1 hypothetical protein BLM14_21475 [Phyllobacterium zundukense]PIO46164.1 hypothetical protein B5P45_03980 [Phyllobacterium zundukense]UXN67480.1 hypothetical protein N8E89_28670 [Phyllobacterium sp. A18/5-2]